MALDRLTLAGAPEARGLRHGERFAGAIDRNVERYLAKWDHYGIDAETAREWAREFVPIIDAENAAYADEMRGVAKGSGVPIEDVTLLNARYEITYGIWAERAGDEATTPALQPDGCTSFGVQQEVTADGRPYLGQNWDWIHDVEVFVMDVRPEDGPNHVAMTEAGIVGGKIGVNEHGIALALNGLVTSADGEHPFRKPYHVRFREILEATRLSEAIEPVLSPERACSANVVLGCAAGEMIDIEALPETANYLHPEDGLLVHANHLERRGGADSRFETLLPDTLCRAPRLTRLLSNRRGDITIDVLREVLRDHFGRPASICRHVDLEKPAQERSATRVSAILDLADRRMLASDGPPCEAGYEEYPVSAS